MSLLDECAEQLISVANKLGVAVRALQNIATSWDKLDEEDLAAIATNALKEIRNESQRSLIERG